LFLLGLPRWSVLGIAYASALAGWLLHGASAVRSMDRGTPLLVTVTLDAVAGAAASALNPTLQADAALIWWPKVVEVAAGDPPYLGAATALHLNPGYPRGMAWLCSVANPLGPPAPAVMKLLSCLWVWLTALVLVSIGRHWLRFGHALSLALVYLLLPEVADHAGSGMPDAAIGAAALLAALGLTERPHRSGYALAAIAGVGAAAIKAEGAVMFVVVWLHFAVDLWRRPDRRRLALGAACVAAVLLPAVVVGSEQPQSRMEVLPFLISNPDVALIRVIAVLETVIRFLVVPGSLANEQSAAGGIIPCWTGLAVMSCLLVLAASRPRGVLAAWPAVMLMPVALAVYATTGADVHWHVRTTFARLMIEMAPTCLLAAAIGLFATASPPAAVRKRGGEVW